VSEIRNCSPEDIPAVAALFQRTFRNAGRPAPAALEAYLAEVHLDHPLYDPEVASRVHVSAQGRVTGFVGVFPGRFEYGGKTFRAAIASSLMAESPEHEPLTGAKLLRSVVKGPQDISISETTNPLSQRLWERLGGKVVSFMSVDWLRVFRPAATLISLAGEKFPRAWLLAPAARLGDRMAGRWTGPYLSASELPSRVLIETNPSEDALTAAVVDLAAGPPLHPRWTVKEVSWLLTHAAKKERHGPVHHAIVRDKGGGLLGCFIFHGRRHGIGRVLQVLAKPGALGDVVDCLFHVADKAGLAGVRGRSTAPLFNVLLERRCLFSHRASTVFHTSHEELREAAESGEALISGLAGESWTRLIGGEFH
jgi:hypothetical protein